MDVDDHVDEESGGSRGSRLVRALVIVVVAVVVLWLLFTQVFPRVERYLEDPTLGAPAAVDTASGLSASGLSASGRG